MSTFDGSAIAANDPNLQLAPVGSEGPNFPVLKKSYEQCIADLQSIVDQQRANFFTRYCLWPGQSADGKKWAREGSKTDPTPWAGASDIRNYLVDDVINSYVAMLRMAFKRASLVADPVEAGDVKRSKIVTDFLRWMIHTQIPNIDREIELLANYICEKGVGALGIFWCEKQEKTLATITIQDLQGKFPDIDIGAVLADGVAADQLAAIFEEQYGCSATKAKRMLRELSISGRTTVPTLGRKYSYPMLRAFNMDEQLFVPPQTTDEDSASSMWRVEYFTPEQLRAFVRSDDWDEAWVEAAIKSCRGKSITLVPSEYVQPMQRSFIYQQQPTPAADKIGVVFGYQRLSDEDGYSGIYLTIFNPSLGPDETHEGYAKFGLLPYAHGYYPFVIFRREELSRMCHDSRGIPEPGKSWQDVIKAHIDSRIDAASISIIPPVGFPMGRPPSRWGPGAKIPERRPGEFHFMEKLPVDGLTETSQSLLTDSFRAYNGLMSKEGDLLDAQTKRQNAVDKFLTGLAKAFNQCYSLYQQYGDDRITFRVIGMRNADAVTFVKGDPNERYDVYLTWDVQSQDMERMETKWKAVIQGIQMLNRDGNVDFAATIQAYIESIDPVVAEKILLPTQQGRDRVVKEEQEDLAQIFAGIPKPIKIGTPPQIALQTMQEYVQNAPDVQQRLQADEAFRKRMETRAKQYQMQTMQEQNKLVGVYGALQPGQRQ